MGIQPALPLARLSRIKWKLGLSKNICKIEVLIKARTRTRKILGKKAENEKNGQPYKLKKNGEFDASNKKNTSKTGTRPWIAKKKKKTG